MQIPGEDFTEMFASVVKFAILWIFLALVAYLDWDLEQIDIVAAFLNGELEEKIYMQVPEEFKRFGNGKMYWKLLKALYGLKQAGRQWKIKLNKVLLELGFVKSIADDCLYLLQKSGKIILMVLVYVDDMAVASPWCSGKIRWFTLKLGDHFEITELGELRHILGLVVTRNRSEKTIHISQTAYIHKMLVHFGMEGATPISTPLAVKYNLSTAQSPVTDDEKAPELCW